MELETRGHQHLGCIGEADFLAENEVPLFLGEVALVHIPGKRLDLLDAGQASLHARDIHLDGLQAFWISILYQTQ